MSNDKKRKKKRLPQKLIAIPNADKKFHEQWKDMPNRDMLNFPHPWRGVIFSNPNCGKTTDLKNILIRADPPFQRLYVVHVDGGYTKEYEDVEAKILDKIPAPDDQILDGKKKTLIILEDLEYKFMSKQQLKSLDRLFGYVSTHKNVSVALLAQDAFNIPPCVRRMSNLWILGKTNDMDSLYMIARKCGMKPDRFKQIFENDIKGQHDKLWIDNTKKSPYPLRLNGYNVIENNMSP
jgi:hypothetical protein